MISKLTTIVDSLLSTGCLVVALFPFVLPLGPQESPVHTVAAGLFAVALVYGRVHGLPRTPN